MGVCALAWYVTVLNHMCPLGSSCSAIYTPHFHVTAVIRGSRIDETGVPIPFP
jgi:hypothetical protein